MNLVKNITRESGWVPRCTRAQYLPNRKVLGFPEPRLPCMTRLLIVGHNNYQDQFVSKMHFSSTFLLIFSQNLLSSCLAIGLRSVARGESEYYRRCHKVNRIQGGQELRDSASRGQALVPYHCHKDINPVNSPTPAQRCQSAHRKHNLPFVASSIPATLLQSQIPNQSLSLSGMIYLYLVSK